MVGFHCPRLSLVAALFVAGYSLSGIAANKEVCVRNFKSDNFDPCTRGFPRYAAVETVTRGVTACVMTYDDSLCKSNQQEFDHVRRADGSVICTIDYHQPPIAAQCATSPDLYVWAPAAYEANP